MSFFGTNENTWVGSNEGYVRNWLPNPDREWNEYYRIGIAENKWGANRTESWDTWLGKLYIYYKDGMVVESLYFNNGVRF